MIFFKQILLLILIFSSAYVNARGDEKGSSDHGLIGRYPNFYIRDYSSFEYDEAEIINGVYDKKNGFESTLTLEGKVTNILYSNKDRNTKVSTFQLYKNYEQALKKLNADFIYKCRGKKCYKNEFTNNGVFMNNALNKNDLIYKGVHSRLLEDFGVLAAKVQGDNGGATYVMISVSSDLNNKERSVMFSIIEPNILNKDNIGIGSVDDLREKINRSGKIELKGIYFDSNKSTLKSESNDTLGLMAAYLKSEPKNNFFIVGHTDNSGSYLYNKTLSKNRAVAVTNILIKKHNILKSQLTAVGVGPVSPQSTNKSENGRVLNRRVELVLDK